MLHVNLDILCYVLSEYGHERWPKHVGVTFMSKLLL